MSQMLLKCCFQIYLEHNFFLTNIFCKLFNKNHTIFFFKLSLQLKKNFQMKNINIFRYSDQVFTMSRNALCIYKETNKLGISLKQNHDFYRKVFQRRNNSLPFLVVMSLIINFTNLINQNSCLLHLHSGNDKFQYFSPLIIHNHNLFININIKSCSDFCEILVFGPRSD